MNNFYFVDSVAPVDHGIRIKESKKINKCLDFAREPWKT